MWAIKHRPEGRFEREDARILQNLARFASAAHQMVLALQAAQVGGRESEARFRSLFERMDQGFCIIEKVKTAPDQPSDFRYVSANPAFERHTGMRDVVGKTTRELVPGAEQSIMEIYDEVVRTGKRRRFEAYVAALDLWMEAEALAAPESGRIAVLFSNVSQRKRAEQALRASEARLAADLAGMRRLHNLHARLATESDLRAALEEIVVAACEFLDTDRGCIQLVSADGERLEMFATCGYGPDSVFIEHFMHEGSEPACEAARRDRVRLVIEDVAAFAPLAGTRDREVALAENICATQSTPIIGRDGELQGVLSNQFRAPHRPTEAQLKLIDVLAWTAADFVAHYRAQAALRVSEERLRLIVESARGYVIFTIDAAGRITGWMAGAQAVFGWRADEAVGQPAEMLFTPEDRAAGAAQQEMDTARAHGSAPDTRWHVKKDGEYVYIDGSTIALRDTAGCVRGFLKIGQDMTQRHLAESALHESEARFRQFGDASSDVLWVRNARTLRFEYLSPAFETVYGIARTDVLAGDHLARWAELVWPEDREAVLAHIERARRGERTTHEFRIRRACDGAVRWLRDTGFALADGGGDSPVQRFGAITQDITERKAAEDQLQHASQAKTEFLAVLAHELRSPLAPLRNAVALLERQSDTAATRPRIALDIMRRQLEHLARLVGDLLEVSRIEHGKIELRIESMVLSSAVSAAIEAVQPMIEARQQRLVVQLPGATLHLAADADRITQVVANLLTNASKFTPDGSAIELTVKDSDSEVVIVVRDTGRSISAEALPHVFELFTQSDGQGLDRAQGGLSIGLALVKRLVELHGGSVAAAIAGKDQGATITVRLPRSGPPAGGQ